MKTNLKKNLNFSELIILIILFVHTVGPVVQASYISYELNYIDGKGFEERPQCLTFNFDDSNTGIIFWSHRVGADSMLRCFKADATGVSPETELGILPGCGHGLSVSKGPDGIFHLVWVNDERDLYYTRYDGTGILEPIQLDTAGFPVVEYPVIDVAQTGDVHIGFAGGNRDLIYIRTVEGVFQPPLQCFIPGDRFFKCPMDLDCGSGNFPVFVSNNKSGQLFVFTFDGVGFTDPTLVPEANSSREKPWILVEDDGKIHLIYNGSHTRASGKSYTQGYHQEGYLDSGFGVKEMIDHDSEPFSWQEPILDSEGCIHVVGVRDYYNDYPGEKGYYFFNNDYGFGNYELITQVAGGVNLNNIICFDIDTLGNISILAYNWDVASFDVTNYTRLHPTEPEIKIKVSSNSPSLDYRDLIYVDLSYYNSLHRAFYADLVVIFEYYNGTDQNPVFYLSADPIYPSFSENPVFFPILLHAGDWHQHIPLLCVDMSTLGPKGLSVLTGTFYAALLDHFTGKLITASDGAFFRYFGD